jgi:tRNA modification GTPase
LRSSTDIVERIGIERTRRELERADAVIAVFEVPGGREEIENLPAGIPVIEVYNKIDLAPGFAVPAWALAVSAKTGQGIEQLRRTILQAAGWSSTGEPVFLARERHLRALEQARGHLDAAARESRRWEFFAEELRLAHAALGSITGEFSTDDLLGEIFARFCIGK